MGSPIDVDTPSLTPVQTLVFRNKSELKLGPPLCVLSDTANSIFRDPCLRLCPFQVQLLWGVSLISLTQKGKADIEKEVCCSLLVYLKPNSTLQFPLGRVLWLFLTTDVRSSTAMLLGSKHFSYVCVIQVLLALSFNKVTGT